MLQVAAGDHDFPTVKLASTRGIDLAGEGYLALSHVWGISPIKCKTTKSNLEEYQSLGIAYERLPRTFQEAVRVTAALGLRHLWIDCLCIIQDDELDWRREAKKMASIYRAATLTLSATSASGSSEGSSLSRLLEPAHHLHGAQQNFRLRDHIFENKNPFGAVASGPTTKRAWILQEKVLSQRILHATDTQLVWQCTTLVESEDGMFYDDGAELSPISGLWADLLHSHALLSRCNPNQFYTYNCWWTWVYDYTRRDLTYASDQHVALSGITDFVKQLSGNEPLLGLWRQHLALHLAWSCERPNSEVSFDDAAGGMPLAKHSSRRPSWTWITFPHGTVNIRNGLEHYSAELSSVKYSAEILHVETAWSDEPLTSVPSGKIRLRGVCRHSLPIIDEFGETKRERFEWDAPYQGPPRSDSPGDILMIALHSVPNTFSFGGVVWLVLVPAGPPEDCEYVRVGLYIVRFFGHDAAWFHPPGEWRTITLVR